MGCSPSRNVGLVTPAGPDVAISAPITAAGAPLTFESTRVSVTEGEDYEDKDPGGKSRLTEPENAQSLSDLRRDLHERKPGEHEENEDLERQKESPNSANSRDSGIDELEEDYAFVITEFSDANKREGIESDFKEEESLVGDETCPGLRKLPPLSLQKALEKKKSVNLTKKDIEEKLEKAEERRKQQEEDKLSKIAGKGRAEVFTNLEQQTTEIKEKYNSKMEHNAKVRQDKLRELQSRLKNHREHVEQVRHRKELLESVPNLDQM